MSLQDLLDTQCQTCSLRQIARQGFGSMHVSVFDLTLSANAGCDVFGIFQCQRCPGQRCLRAGSDLHSEGLAAHVLFCFSNTCCGGGGGGGGGGDGDGGGGGGGGVAVAVAVAAAAAVAVVVVVVIFPRLAFRGIPFRDIPSRGLSPRGVSRL